jgi:hypothetical protein
VTGAEGRPEQRAPYHPVPAAHEAVAELVLDALR